MKTLKLNSQGDLEFDNRHSLKLVEDKEEVKQSLKIELSTNVGEWFLNLQFGVPWIEMLSGEPPERFRAEISKILNADPAVEEIKSVNVNLNRSQRYLEIGFQVKIDGELINERVVI